MTLAIVTGGTRSLGKRISAMLEANLIDVITLSHQVKDKPDILCDLSVLNQYTALEIINEHRPDILINNAGVTRLAYNEDLFASDWDYVHAVNVRAPFLLSQAMLRAHGRTAVKKTIVNIASMGYRNALRCSVAYNSSKAGLVMVTKQMAREAADRFPGFVFYAVSPNSMEGTDMIEQCRKALVDVRGMSEEASHQYLKASPLGRLEDMSDVVSTVRYLVMDRPVYMTGTNIEHTGASQA